jgi:site-specific recombinase XerD
MSGLFQLEHSVFFVGIRNQCDFLAVKDILGHSKSETTLQYCALSGVELKDAFRKCHPRYDTDGVDATANIQRIG